jgi:hypothetical protein
VTLREHAVQQTSTTGERGLRDPFVIRSPEGDRLFMGYLPFETTDLASGEWTPSTDYQLPASPRHGTVIPVTRAEYDRLLAAYPESPASVVDATARGQKGWAVVSEETSKVVLPMEPRANLRALAPRLYVGEGATVSPRSGTRRDFRGPQTYTVTAADGTRRVWTVEAVPTRSPVLPGLYADPDVRYMDGRYWIYPTTDGFPGWSGTRFKAFSSRDLVHWTDHGVVLDFGPDVAWARFVGGADPRVGQSGAAVTDSSQAKTSSCMRRGKACPVSGRISVRSRSAAPSESQTARSRA